LSIIFFIYFIISINGEVALHNF